MQKRLETVENPNYIPCIYVNSKKKGPLFGQVQQDINRHGAGTLSAQIGFRSPFQKYDHLQLNAEWPVQTKLNKRYYQFALAWHTPLKKYGDFFVKGSAGNDPAYENIDIQNHGFSWGLSKGQENYEVEWSHRVPFIHKNTTAEIRNGFYRPSTKFSFKYSRTLENSIKQNSIREGSFSQIKTELGLPLLGNSQFLRLEYKHRRFFDTFALRKWTENDWLKYLSSHSGSSCGSRPWRPTSQRPPSQSSVRNISSVMFLSR